MEVQSTYSPQILVGNFDVADDFSTGIATVDVLIGIIEFQQESWVVGVGRYFGQPKAAVDSLSIVLFYAS